MILVCIIEEATNGKLMMTLLYICYVGQTDRVKSYAANAKMCNFQSASSFLKKSVVICRFHISNCPTMLSQTFN